MVEHFKKQDGLKYLMNLTNFDEDEILEPTLNLIRYLVISDDDLCMEFSDYKNDISANLEFTPAPKFYQKFKEPTDVFRGDLKKGDKCVHKIFGSPIDKLVFDNEL